MSHTDYTENEAGCEYDSLVLRDGLDVEAEQSAACDHVHRDPEDIESLALSCQCSQLT